MRYYLPDLINGCRNSIKQHRESLKWLNLSSQQMSML